jgi:hypothetical protein
MAVIAGISLLALLYYKALWSIILFSILLALTIFMFYAEPKQKNRIIKELSEVSKKSIPIVRRIK